MSSPVRRGPRILSALAGAILLAGCADSPTDPPREEPIRTLTVNASQDWGFAALRDDTAGIVSVADAAASTAWDLGFFKSAVKVNGGAAGPAGIVATCLCQNAGSSDADLQAMTPESELADFLSVTAAQIPPAGAAWTSDVFETKPWSRYNLAGNHQIWPTYDVYLVKRGSEVYKIQLISYYGPGGETRQITFRYVKLVG